jgi:hypothetical protein
VDSQFMASPHTAAGVSFRGVAAADPPGELYLIETDVAATVTSLTPDKWRQPLGAPSKCVGGAALTGHTATAEGTITASRLLDAMQVHPQTGYSIWWQSGREPRVEDLTVTRFLRIRANYSVNIDAVPWIVWDE